MAIHLALSKLKWLLMRLWGIDNSTPPARPENELRESAGVELKRANLHRRS